MEVRVQVKEQEGITQLEEATKRWQKERQDLEKQLQEAKEDCKERLDEKERVLQRQASSSERALKEREQASKDSEAALINQWTSKLEAARQSHERELADAREACEKEKQLLKAEHAAREVVSQNEQATLRSEHQAALSTVVADAKSREASLKQEQVALKAEHETAMSMALARAADREADLKKDNQAVLDKQSQEAASNIQTLQTQMAAISERCSSLSEAKLCLESEQQRLHEAVGQEQASLEKTRVELQSTSSKLASANETLASTKAELEATKSTLERLTTEKRELDLEYRSFREHNASSEESKTNEISKLTLAVEALHVKVDGQTREISTKSNDIELHQRSVRMLEEQLAQAELSRRDLHNTIQELKGNIRVLCRVRPADKDDTATSLAVSGDTKLTLVHGSETYPYTFDRAFSPASTQQDIFDNVEGLVQSALDGYKVCIFAYGQTGSGKTYTMQGKPHDKSQWGLIPRALEMIFTTSKRMCAQGWQWSLKASFIEVYNEVLKDLLREGKGDTTPQCHTIKNDPDWGAVVTNVECVEVDSMVQIDGLMTKAEKLRAVGATDMNAQSSRSHSIFALYITGTNTDLNTELHGALHLVDLAGSERLDKSGATGDRLKETQNINKSLSSLADVFAAKAENRSHIPFRNSKLTYLMEPCLSGSGKTLMFVNVGPEADNSHETCCSLRFAGQVAKCTTGGKPTKCVRTASAASSSTSNPRAPASSSTSKSLAASKCATLRKQ
jgi:kinesin family protein C1